MEQGNLIQVLRWHDTGESRLLYDVWEIGAGDSVRRITGGVSAAYTDGKDDTYEVITMVDGVTVHTRKLCWDTPPRCRKERLCVVVDDRLEDFREYCEDFLS